MTRAQRKALKWVLLEAIDASNWRDLTSADHEAEQADLRSLIDLLKRPDRDELTGQLRDLIASPATL